MGGEEEKKGDEEKKPSPYTLSKEQIAEIPLGGFRGRITVAYTPQKADEAASFLSRYHFLGFDTETKPVFKKGQKQNPIALIQLSTERHAFLFRVSETGMTPALKEILESPKIRKIGQAMKHELVTMKKELKVEGRGFIDLLDIAHRLECEPKSVKGMAAIFLGISITARHTRKAIVVFKTGREPYPQALHP